MLISVVTINYNDHAGLDRTINSVLSQSYSEFEYIVIDGNSNDGSQEIIEKNSKRISKWISEPDTGIYNAMNKGIRMATGEYCIMMNSGDVFYSSNVLKKASKKLAGGADIYNGNAIYVNGNKQIEWYRKGHKDISTLHFFRSSICHQATFIKTDLLKKYFYDESLRMVSDWKFWIQTICKDHVSYKTMDIDICCFDTGGLTNKRQDVGILERRKVLSELFSPEEIDRYNKLLLKGRKIKFIKEGFICRFWLYYARLFKMHQVRKVL